MTAFGRTYGDLLGHRIVLSIPQPVCKSFFPYNVHLQFSKKKSSTIDGGLIQRPWYHIIKVRKPCFNSAWIPLLINGFAPVKTCLLIPCSTDFYAIIDYGKCTKISNTGCLTKRSRQTRQTQIRLLLMKQSDRGLPCLLFWQALCGFQPWKPTFCLRKEGEKCSKF